MNVHPEQKAHLITINTYNTQNDITHIRCARVKPVSYLNVIFTNLNIKLGNARTNPPKKFGPTTKHNPISPTKKKKTKQTHKIQSIPVSSANAQKSKNTRFPATNSRLELYTIKCITIQRMHSL